jgi:hypothetical protein
LLTAISKLEEKNIMIGIITNVLKD